MHKNFYFLKEFMQGYLRIKGPRSVRDRIAIVGAGPAGLHMAYELKV
jgi:NADPH-dependent glutamate synthase beta subunit-like oxidoreductase